MDNLIFIASVSVSVLVGMITIGLIMARLYNRASKEVSFVRTGFGGQKVIMNGGALVIPILHEIIPVNMNTLRLEVRRSNDQALITRDRMRVDVAAEFYTRVKPSEESIAMAAQTLGYKTLEPMQLKELVEGKFVDALRSVAAEMSMEELHEKRTEFVQRVQNVVSEDLTKNGLELETVSLTGLDQTSREFFNPDNAFDAAGLTRLTMEIEEKRKTRNDVEQDTNVAIANKNLEAEQKQLQIAKNMEYARLEQEREIEIRRASQATEIARERAQKKQEADEAQIQAKRQVDMTTILAERAVEEEQIEKERNVKERDISRIKALESAEIERMKTVELAEQDKEIALAEKSKAKSEARAEADKALALAVREEEAVKTVRETAEAERVKAVDLVQARKLAERDAIAVLVQAQADKKAALDRAEASRIQATAEADRKRIEAEGEAEAMILSANAAEKQYQVDAEGTLALNEAANKLSQEQVRFELKKKLIAHLPEIIRESVRPMEKIEGIKIFHLEGMPGSNGHVQGEASTNSTNLADQVVNSALRYRGQAPLLDSLLAEIGLKPGDINGLTAPIGSMANDFKDSAALEIKNVEA
ncbi:Uncharacterized membrane protein YqiK, contains Band7/PHB/SPFH domain [Desulfomicrobium apsheronum]|uniref:Uncharacterized membrane protein YqiK, contains Band7/PHB/SPFH domain n=1 Tax=Desulfomicrobium apsheronum TaxID=52560 RepID=A0A1I3U3Z0_9BACT|nr:flotillin family protein [Desulfomicrobium apsheronum]SFJ77463.1 Uncharacterized membrane protein YqiK, contains Band7/PHB/SPFH domain [Desulfomicrobium apsheronum]